MKITPDVLNVLAAASVNGNALTLPYQLDRALYTRTDKVIKAAGGAWNRKAGSHLFPFEAADAIDAMLTSGEVTRPQDFGYFPTPPAVVERMIRMAGLAPGMRVLEPSAGRGAIAEPVAARGHAVDCVELLDDNAAAIRDGRYAAELAVGDFLDVSARPLYPRVLMNPPFGRQADIRHVTHAHRFLEPGGLLVAVMSNGVTFRDNRLTQEFRALIERCGGAVRPLPAGSFTISGTSVHTVLTVLPADPA